MADLNTVREQPSEPFRLHSASRRVASSSVVFVLWKTFVAEPVEEISIEIPSGRNTIRVRTGLTSKGISRLSQPWKLRARFRRVSSGSVVSSLEKTTAVGVAGKTANKFVVLHNTRETEKERQSSCVCQQDQASGTASCMKSAIPSSKPLFFFKDVGMFRPKFPQSWKHSAILSHPTEETVGHVATVSVVFALGETTTDVPRSLQLLSLSLSALHKQLLGSDLIRGCSISEISKSWNQNVIQS